MKLTVQEFLARYEASGVASANETVDRLLELFASQHGGRRPKDVSEAARWLLRRGALTRYQAQRLAADEPSDLRLGEYRIRGPINDPPFAGWWSALAADGSQVRLFLGSPELSAEAQQRLAAHASLASPHLQKIEAPVAVEKAWPRGAEPTEGAQSVPRLLHVCRLAAGSPAAAALSGQGLAAPEVIQLGRQLCSALSAVHTQGLHLPIADATRLWIAKPGLAILLRDPLADPRTGTGGWFAPPAIPGLYLAPERQGGDRAPDAASDVYSLGCLLFQLRFGQPPFAAATEPALAEQHANTVPEPIQAAIAAAERGDPLLRVIGHAMAKNREARFTDARQLDRALAAVESAYARDDSAELPSRPSPAAAAAVAANARTAESPAERPATSPESGQAAATPRTGKDKPQPGSSSPAVDTPLPAAASAAIPPTIRVAPAAAAPEPAAPDGAPPAPVAAAVAPVSGGRPLRPKKSRVTRTRRKKNRTAPLILGGLGFLVMLLLVLLLVQEPGGGSTSPQASGVPAPPPPRAVRGETGPEQAAASALPRKNRGSAERPSADAPGVVLSDASDVLWAAPSTGAAPELSLVPPGAGMIVSFRPDRLAKTDAGQQLTQALSPELTEGLQHLESRLGVPLAEVQRLTLAVEGAGGGMPQASLAVELVAPQPLKNLRDRWEADEAQTASGHTVYVGSEANGDVFYVPPGESTEVRRFAVGTADQIERIAEIEGAPVPLPRSHDQLWRSLGSDPDVAVLLGPNFLFADGRQMLARFAPAVAAPLRRLLIPDATALALRMDLEPQWYTEVRLAPGGSISPIALAKNLDDAIASLPGEAEQFLLNSSPHPSWRALALRLPAMMRAVDTGARTGVVDASAVANLYLPAQAAPNVLLGSWLAANTPVADPSTLAAADVTPPENAGSMAPQTLEEMLEMPLTVRFDQESLEFAAETIREQFNEALPPQSPQLKIVLLGGDLQLAGITQNQQIREFEHRDATLRTVLDDLVRRANPDKTATSLDQEAQKLVWALGPDPDAPDPADPASRAVLITTRDKAIERYELPAQFRVQQP